MLVLAIDTSAIASAALIRADSGQPAEVLERFATADTRSHAEVLAPGIEAVLAGGDRPDVVVVGVGPGPFTGLRSGIITARTLASVWGSPVHGVMSLDAIALDAATLDAATLNDGPLNDLPLEAGAHGGEFLVATDARRREVYWARYRGSGPETGPPTLLDGPHVGPADELPALPVYGRGGGLYPETLAVRDGYADLQPTAASLGLVAVQRLASGVPLADTTPLYLRESDAKVPGPRKRVL